MKVRVEEAKELLDRIFDGDELGLVRKAISTHVEELGKLAKKEQQRLVGEHASEEVCQALYLLTGSEDAESGEAAPAVIHCFQPMSFQEIQDLETRQMDLEDAATEGYDDASRNGPRLLSAVEKPDAACIVCGCTDDDGCRIKYEDGKGRMCAWAELDRNLGFGLCDNPACMDKRKQWLAFVGLCTTETDAPSFETHLTWASERTIHCVVAATVADDGTTEEVGLAEVLEGRLEILRDQRHAAQDDDVIDADYEIIEEDASPEADGLVTAQADDFNDALVDASDDDLEAARAILRSNKPIGWAAKGERITEELEARRKSRNAMSRDAADMEGEPETTAESNEIKIDGHVVESGAKLKIMDDLRKTFRVWMVAADYIEVSGTAGFEARIPVSSLHWDNTRNCWRVAGSGVSVLSGAI